MGLHSGTVSVSRYHLIGYSKTSLKRLGGKLESFKLSSPQLDETLAKEERCGWVCPVGVEDELDSFEHWDLSHCRFEQGFVLRMRIEKRRVPNELLQLMLRQKLHELSEDDNSQASRALRKKVRDDIKQELTSRALPNITHVDAWWNEDTSEVLLFANGNRTRELFEDLFRKTFAKPLESSLVRVEAPLLGMDRNDWGKPDYAVAKDIHHLIPAPMTFGAS